MYWIRKNILKPTFNVYWKISSSFLTQTWQFKLFDVFMFWGTMGNFIFLSLGALETNCSLRPALIGRCFLVNTFTKMAISRIFILLCRLLVPLLYRNNEPNIKFFSFIQKCWWTNSKVWGSRQIQYHSRRKKCPC